MSMFSLLEENMIKSKEELEVLRKKTVLDIVNMQLLRTKFPYICRAEKYVFISFLLLFQRYNVDFPNHTLIPVPESTKDPRDKDVTELFVVFASDLVNHAKAIQKRRS